MASRIAYEPRGEPVRQRRPRVESAMHLAFIRKLSCVICGSRPVDPAHLRTAMPLLVKRAVGVAEKPSDHWCTPLCRKHHDEQHSMNEEWYWRSYGIENPWQFCLALWAASTADDLEIAEAIVAEHRILAMQASGVPFR